MIIVTITILNVIDLYVNKVYNKYMKKIWALIIILITSFMLFGCTRNERIYSADGFVLDTYVQITIYEGGSQKIADEAFSICSRYEKIFSRTDENSALCKLNVKGNLTMGNDDIKELATLIEFGLEYSRITEGNFDITVAPLVEIWDFKKAEVPSDSEIKDALGRIGYDRVQMDEQGINLNGTRIDLGAIAKGYIADRIKEYLVKQGVTSAMINLGGNILCIGDKPGDKNFTIGIKKPFATDNDVIIGLEIDDKSVVTSGIYERYFEKEGILYHHVIDPETGRPAEAGLYSVTIISEESYVGDALSTACLVMGLEEGMKLIDSLDDVYAIFVDNEYNIYYSAGAEDFVR